MAGVLAWRMRESAKAMARTWKSQLLARIPDQNVRLKATELEAHNAYQLCAKDLSESLREPVTLCDVLNGANEHLDGILEVFQRCFLGHLRVRSLHGAEFLFTFHGAARIQDGA